MDKETVISINAYAQKTLKNLHESYRTKLIGMYRILYKEYQFTHLVTNALSVDLASILNLVIRGPIKTIVVDESTPPAINDFAEALEYYVLGRKRTGDTLRFIGSHVVSVEQFDYLVHGHTGNTELDNFKEANQDKFAHLYRIQLLSKLD